MTGFVKTHHLHTKIIVDFFLAIMSNDIKNSHAKFDNDMKLSCQAIQEYVHNTLVNKLSKPWIEHNLYTINWTNCLQTDWQIDRLLEDKITELHWRNGITYIISYHVRTAW